MLRTLVVALLLALLPQPVPAADFRPNEPLGELLSKTKSLSMPNNAGGKNILENSCLNKKDFSMTASEEFLDHCDLPAATTQFVTKYGPPATTGQAPGGKTVLEYFLHFKENDYHVRVFLGCSEGKTERFAIVECVAERNRFMPGGPPGDHRGGPGGPRGRHL
jgi:hypothetical protein